MTRASEPFSRHDECTVFVAGFPEEVFAFADDHSKFSAHMSGSSWMMLGSKMTTATDAERGQNVGSHITMTGNVLGIQLSLDEVVVERIPPWEKAWETVGTPRLLVIGAYRMGFRVLRHDRGAVLTVFIDYDLPANLRWLGSLFGRMYARWCVKQMAVGVERHFGRLEGVSA